MQLNQPDTLPPLCEATGTAGRPQAPAPTPMAARALPCPLPHARPRGRWLVPLVGALAAGLLGGCAFFPPQADPTRFYVLTSPTPRPDLSSTRELKRWRVGLRSVELPAYLRNRALVVRVGTTDVHFAEFDRWAEPLDRGIGRLLSEALESSRNLACVGFPSPPDATLDYEVTIRVRACEGTRGERGKGGVRFAAEWEARSAGSATPLARSGVVVNGPAQWNGKDYGQLVERLSEAVMELGESIAGGLLLEAGAPDAVSQSGTGGEERAPTGRDPGLTRGEAKGTNVTPASPLP